MEKKMENDMEGFRGLGLRVDWVAVKRLNLRYHTDSGST